MKQGIGSTFWARRPPMELVHILKALIIERGIAALKKNLCFANKKCKKSIFHIKITVL